MNSIFINLMVFVGVWHIGFAAQLACFASEKMADPPSEKPNLILIMTDDLGIGDLGYMGNPFIHTPNIDRLASKSTRFSNFHVNPVCSPTRAAVMTGKFPEKTGIYDTYNGGSIMASEEITLAEVLKAHGYHTAIFGKWHLGDNHPYRPMDQGFMTSLVHKGGGIGQPGDVDNFPAGDSSYFNPILYENETKTKTKGYCSDVFTAGAIDFIQKNAGSPFFLYLSFNAPHTPLQVPKEYDEKYRHISLADYKQKFKGKDGDIETMTEKDLDDARKVYGMVSNIDDNIGKLQLALQKMEIADNTIIVFMSDNGPQQKRFKLHYRGRKGSVYEGGVRVPFFVHGPENGIPLNQDVDVLAAHIDLMPTFLAFAGATGSLPENLDGYNLVPLIKNDHPEPLKRSVFTEWGRGYPMPYQNMSVHQWPYKLVAQTDYRAPINKFELYNLANDPLEQANLITREKQKALEMKAELDEWLEEINAHPNNNRVHPIKIGLAEENPVVLNRNDAKGPIAPWNQSDVFGYWDIEIVEDGIYNFTFQFFDHIDEPGNMRLKLYPYHFSMPHTEINSNRITLEKIKLHKGRYSVEPSYFTKNQGHIFPFFVEVERDI